MLGENYTKEHFDLLLNDGTELDSDKVLSYLAQMSDRLFVVIHNIETHPKLSESATNALRTLTLDLLEYVFVSINTPDSKHGIGVDRLLVDNNKKILGFMYRYLYILYGGDLLLMFNSEDDESLDSRRFAEFIKGLRNIRPSSDDSLDSGIVHTYSSVGINQQGIKVSIPTSVSGEPVMSICDDMVTIALKRKFNSGDETNMKETIACEVESYGGIPQLGVEVAKIESQTVQGEAARIRERDNTNRQVCQFLRGVDLISNMTSIMPYMLKNLGNQYCMIMTDVSWALGLTIYMQSKSIQSNDSEAFPNGIYSSFNKTKVTVSDRVKHHGLNITFEDNTLNNFFNENFHVDIICGTIANAFRPNIVDTYRYDVDHFTYYRSSLYEKIASRLQEKKRVESGLRVDSVLSFDRAYVRWAIESQKIDLEDARAGARRVVKTVVGAKKKLDVSIEKKVKDPIINNVDGLVDGLTGNETATEKEKQTTRVALKEGRYSPSFILKKIFALSAKSGVAFMIGGPVVGVPLAGLFSYMEFLRTKKNTRAERTRYINQIDDSIELVNIKIEAADTPKKKIALVKVRQKLESEKGKIAKGVETVKKSDKD